MNRTKIEYADYSWNPVTGCTFGCEWCFARGIAERFSTHSLADWQGAYAPAVQPADGAFPAVFWPTLYPHRLAEPAKVKKPSVIFACDVGDLFGPEVSDSFRDQVFTAMAVNARHTFLVLTKRAEAMRGYVQNRIDSGLLRVGLTSIPFPNVWLGVSVTNQPDAAERIPILLDTPAAHRWMSYEPALAPVSFGSFWGVRHGIDWLVVGPLTGPKAAKWHRGRAANSWCDDAIRQAQAAGVPVFDKREQAVVRELPWKGAAK